MNTYHEPQLYSRLDELLLRGQTFISWREMYLWYGVEKIAARTWRDILRRWTEYTKEHEGREVELTVTEQADGAVIRRDLFKEEKKKSWKLKGPTLREFQL